ncbi:MAG: hypothetical protein HPY85_06595 [Anaerolineae bacterium]|nr:hypothetical protein [Anaerolineae bacterium]
MKKKASFTITENARGIIFVTLLVFLFVFIIYTCQNFQQHTISTNNTPLLTPTKTDPQNSSITLTTEIQISPTYSITETVNTLDYPGQFLNIYEHGQIPEKFKGILLLNNVNNNSAVTIELSGDVQYPIVSESDTSIKWNAISPNNDKVFFTKRVTEATFVSGIMTFNEGEPITQFELTDCMFFLGWLDKNHVLCFDDVYSKVNASTGEKSTFSLELPNTAVPIGVAADYYSPVVSPDLSRVVYLSEPSYAGANIVLWDIQQNLLIQTFSSTGNPYGGKPEWSHSGDTFVFTLMEYMPEQNVVRENLYVVDRNGAMIQLLDLDGLISCSQNILIDDYHWSPDDKKIAFWLSCMNGDISNNRLAIMNVSKNEINLYALDYFIPSFPVWSPDGNAMVVSSWMNDHITTLIIDLITNNAYKITENTVPIGWMTQN